MTEPEGSLLTEPAVDNSQQEWYGESSKELVESKGWKTADDAIGSYRELEKSMGGKLKMPTPESSAEEIRAFYQKTGCPENPDGYEVPAVEGAESFKNEGVENSMKQIAYDQGVSKQAFEAIVRGYYEQMSADLKASQDQGETALKTEWIDKYDENIVVAQRFVNEYNNEAFNELMETTHLGNHPEMLKFCEWAGRKTMSDTFIKGGIGDVKGDKEYTPAYPNSPEMYKDGDDEESKKGREYHTARGFKY